jgi:2',3'-cyclic-nucleotide 2'-phosphodiesterase (5'-nucleotidase family)
MRFLRLRYYLQMASVTILLGSCQKAWYPVAQLPAETDIKLSATLPPETTAEVTITPYRQKMARQMNEVLGTSAQELPKVGVGETALGNFVTQVQLAQSLPLYKKDIDMSLMTTGGLRAGIPQGPVTLSHIFELSPFENQLVILTLTGPTVQKLFNEAARTRELIIQNATFTIKDAKPTQILINGKPLDSGKTYKVVMSDYLANGGDDLSFLSEATAVEPVGILVREALIKHIRELNASGKSIEARIDGRMKVQ